MVENAEEAPGAEEKEGLRKRRRSSKCPADN